jgi:serine/threonine-protein kinase
MAQVHTATDLRLGREVAVKVLRSDLARDPAFLARFRREAQAAASLNHPNIVGVYDTGEDLLDATNPTFMVPWIVMEKVEGHTLRHIISAGRKISPDRALDILIGVLSALDYSHRHGIVHRDIKPANVMITTHGDVKVMDFGIARAIADASATMTHSNAVMGTAHYLSPEQAKGDQVDARSDIYSAGCLLYELLTSKPPFTGDSAVAIAYQHVSESAVAPSLVNDSVPALFDAVVMKSLMKNPDDRYHTAAEMRADLELLLQRSTPRYAQGSTISDTQPIEQDDDATKRIPIVATNKSPKRTKSEEQNIPMIVGAGIAVVAVVIGALVLISKWISPAPVDQIAVPDVIGLTIEQATAELNNDGLVIGEVTYQEAVDRPENTIISQNPSKDTNVDRGTAINVIISQGKGQVEVPNLINFSSVDDARQALINAQLTLGAVTREASDLPPNTVLRSDPIAGTLVDKGSAVAIVVSSGSVEVPNVVGQDASAARITLANEGFIVETVYLESDEVAAGTVISQSPGGGEMGDFESTVTITVAKLPGDPDPGAGDPNA